MRALSEPLFSFSEGPFQLSSKALFPLACPWNRDPTPARAQRKKNCAGDPSSTQWRDPFMSARLLTAYLVSVGLAAGIISQALAKPPDLPAKVQINCEKCSDKLVLKTYQVADLVVPIESAPWPDLVCPAP